MKLSRTNSTIPLSLILLLFCFASGYGQYGNKLNSNGNSFILQQTFQDSLSLYQERGVLHIANKQIDNGRIFFKAYLISGLQNLRSSISSVLNVELVDVKDSIIKKQFHKILDGTVEGNMELSKSIVPGTYYLRAYTRWMKNYDKYFFAKKQIWVGESTNETKESINNSDILIFPEGGVLLNGIKNKVLVKLPHMEMGNDKNVGRILDENGKVVGTVKNYSGIGAGFYEPMSGMTYLLELKNGVKVPMPVANDQGCLLQVNNLGSKSINIRVTATSDYLGTSVKLIGALNGTKYFENDLVFEDSNVKDVVLSKVDIPRGILLLTLKGEGARELAKRPIWVEGERLNVDISQVGMNSNESTFRIKVTDDNNLPVTTQVALSINKLDSNYDNLSVDNSIVWSDLFTLPEIKIDNKNLAERKRRFLRDLIVLMSGLDSINYSYKVNQFRNQIQYPVQKGLEVIGYAYDLNNNLLVNTNIQVMILNDEKSSFRETKTDINGLLRLNELQIDGKATLVFRTRGKDTKSSLVKVILAEDWEIHETENPKTILKSNDWEQAISDASTQFVDTTGVIELDEVQVSENRPKVQKSMQSVYGIEIPESRIKYQDYEKPKSIAQMISEIPGVMVTGMGEFEPTVKITRANGAGPVLFVLDGIPLSQGSGSGYEANFFDKAENSLVPLINRVSAVDVERVELMFGADASIYGSRASGGVILVYTRSGSSSDYIKRKEGQLELSGYEPFLDFEAYREELSKKSRKESNILYWNPKLETDENGEVIINLPISPSDSNIRIEASAITPDGKVGWSSSIY